MNLTIKQLKQIFRQVYTCEQQVDSAVRDAIKAYTIIKQDPDFSHGQ